MKFKVTAAIFLADAVSKVAFAQHKDRIYSWLISFGNYGGISHRLELSYKMYSVGQIQGGSTTRSYMEHEYTVRIKNISTGETVCTLTDYIYS